MERVADDDETGVGKWTQSRRGGEGMGSDFDPASADSAALGSVRYSPEPQLVGHYPGHAGVSLGRRSIVAWLGVWERRGYCGEVCVG